MRITHQSSVLELYDLPLDIGYASEKVELKDCTGSIVTIGGQNGTTQLLISAPFIDDGLLTQMSEMDTLLSLNALDSITKGLIVASDTHHLPTIDGWLCGYDADEAFGDYYGVRLNNDQLAKTLFVLSKDGAVFYHEILKDLDAPFSIEKALAKIVAAQSCYTGKGCHG